MSKRYVEITNTPPRTSSPKHLEIGDNYTDGNLTFTLYGGWSEYKRGDVLKIMAAMQEWLDALERWVCPKCLTENETTPAPGTNYDYTWVRCVNCKKKTDRSKLEFTKPEPEVQHI